MSEERISDAELNALVDGELDPSRQAEIEVWLAENPDTARRVARYRAQNAGFHALFDDILHEEISPKIMSALTPVARAFRPGRPWLLRLPCSLLAAQADGWRGEGAPIAGQQVAAGPPIDTAELMVRASMAHVVSRDDELRTPTSGGSAGMGDYLADRMGKAARVPSLDTFGYRLVGSRVLPDTNGPAAQFVFSDESGKKVSLYVRGEQANGVDITYALADDLSMFYWNDSDRSYAMVTRVDDERGSEALLTAAKAVFGQLSQ
jgi:anti-sigma factor RsiW